MSDLRRRHHTVPRLHLRHFANPAKKIVQLDLESGRRRVVSIADAAVIRDFYTITLPDGTRTDAWERWLGDLEDEMAPALQRAIKTPDFHLSDEDRWCLARWIALQFLRGPDNRRRLAELGSFAVHAQVGMGGIAYLQHSMSLGLGRAVSLAEAEPIWNDITAADGPNIVVPSDEHLKTLTRTFDQAAAVIYARSWGRIRFKHRTLALSDAPVCLIPAGNGAFSAGGLTGSRAITAPLDRRNLLWLELPDDTRTGDDHDLEPSTLLARGHNLAAIASAERFLYFHPDDDPVPADLPFPRPRPRRLVNSGGADFVNRERALDDVLAQISGHAERNTESLIANYEWPIPGYRPRSAPVSSVPPAS